MTSLLNSSNASVPAAERLGAPARTKRAWILWLLTLLVPGGAQIVTGYKRLGRIALSVTVTVWALLLALLVTVVINRSLVLDFFNRHNILVATGVVLIALALGWLLMFIHTFTVIKPGLLAPGMRGIVSVVTLLAVVVTTGGLSYGAFVAFKSQATLSTIFSNGPAIDPVDGRYNILVIGADAGDNRTGLRPDSAQVWSIDAKTGQALVISIPRNLQNVPFPKDSPLHKEYPDGFDCGDECIFNAIYPIVEQKHKDLYPKHKDPGAQATMEASSAVTGLDVQAYVTVDMGGFEDLIDALGGVSITSGGWVPYNSKKDPETGLRTRWMAPGKHNFKGKEALWYARSRDFSTDYHRIRRQQCMQQAMVNQFTPQNILTNFNEIMNSGEQIVRTDLPQSQLGSFTGLAEKTRKHKLSKLTLGAPDFGKPGDLFSTYPDYDQIHERIQQKTAEASEQGSGKEETPKESSKPKPSQKPDAESSSGKPSSKGSSKSSSTSGLSTEDQTVTEQPDGSEITEEYLQELELMGDTGRLEQIAQTNDQCKAG